MTNPILSIITPSYNQADFIEKCLLSVKNQDYGQVEHVVVDGGSSDGTIKVLKRYEDEYNLRWVSEPDEGQSNAVNKGIRMAQGDWIGWQNSDDFYLPGAFEIFREAERDHSEADLIYGDVIVVDEDGQHLKRLFQTKPSKLTHRYWSLFARNQGTFLHEDLLMEVGGLNEDLEYAMDEDLFWRTLHTDPNPVNIPHAIGAFRIQDGAKTHGRSHDSWEYEYKQIYDETRYDQIVPNCLLKTAGKTIKGIHLASDRRWDALQSIY